MSHDKLCPNYEEICCPWMGECSCQCLCEFILEIRKDEDSQLLEHISKLQGKQRIWLLRSTNRREIYWNESVHWVLRLVSMELNFRRGNMEAYGSLLKEELKDINRRHSPIWNRLRRR